MSTPATTGIRDGYAEKYGFHDADQFVFKSRRGLDREIVAQISALKGEPLWMRDYRIKALEIFEKKPLPTWGGNLSEIDFQNIFYYVKPTDKEVRSWDEVPDDMKRTFDRLGIPEAEQKFLSGVGAQYDSEVVYHKVKESLEKQGVIFLSADQGLKEHEALFKEYFGTVIPSTDNKFAALNSAVWSGGSFIYVPKGVQVEVPLQAYFRINTKDMGQFERTLIIVDEGAWVHYVEGCLPPGEQVSLGDRWANVESVRPGDVVMDSEGRESVVASARARPFRGELVKLVPLSAANAFQVTPEHPVLAVRRRDVRARRDGRGSWLGEVDGDRLRAAKPEFVPAGEIERGDFVVFPVSKITRPDPSLTREVVRLLGYYLAEGSTYVHRTLKVPVVGFSFSELERDTIEDVKALIANVTGKRAMEIHDRRKHGVEVRVYSRELRELCLEHCGQHAAEKHLSKAVMELPAELQAELLETYLKGDGSVYRKRKHLMVRAATVSQALAWQLQELIARQGHFATINVRRGGKDTIQGREITRRDQYILYYSPDKQKSEVRRGDGCFLVPVKRIERTPYEGPVFNFELEREPNAYLARGFAVHNCTAPVYASDSLHSAVVEIIVKRGARCRYTTIQNWSNNVYNLVTKRAMAYRDATMEWVDANLGCLTGDAGVLLNSDVRAIRDVEQGDTVYSLDENMQWARRPVLAKRYSGQQRIFRMRTENHREIRATANHPFLALSKHGRQLVLAWKRLDQLTTDDRVAISGEVPDHGKSKAIEPIPARGTKRLRLPESSSDELLWLLGLYVGDGYVDRSRVYFAVPPSDKSHARLLGLLGELFDSDYEVRRGVVRINSVLLRDWLMHLGFAGNARQKRVPDWVYRLPRSQRLEFIEGYVAADGYRRANHKNLSITSVNRALLEDVKSLAIACGLDPRKISRWTRRELKPLGREEKEYTHYFLYFGEKPLEQSVYFSRVAAIEPQGVEDTWDIEVEGSHNFVANGFVVHNSKLTMKYPSVYMMEPGAHGEILSIAFAGKGQHQDAGGKVVHAAPHTSSKIVSKSISKDGGRAGYRGLVKVVKGAVDCRSNVNCDALLLDEASRSDTYPYMEIEEDKVSIGHEATVSKIGDEQLFYLQSRGINKDEAAGMIVSGFIEPIVKELPMEYAVEMNRLIQLQMEGSVG